MTNHYFQTVVWTTADYFAYSFNYRKISTRQAGRVLGQRTRPFFSTRIGERASSSHAHCQTRKK